MENTLDFAKKMDEEDVLKDYRQKFFIPILHGAESIYFRGNALGLQPRSAQDFVLNEMEDWATYGAEANQLARRPWAEYHQIFSEKIAPLVGGKPSEVVVMNQLTANLHLLLTSFYRPTKSRYKILIEEHAFSSDRFAVLSHLALAGFTEKDALIIVKAKPGKWTVDNEDIFSAIENHASELALVLIGSVNYLTGQLFPMQEITTAAHDVGALCGWDLAHAIGNIPMELNRWEVDFACWCSYKYLNGGPGGIGGAFIHERYADDHSLKRLAGWWGQKRDVRFLLSQDFIPESGAEGWQLSSPPILSLAAQLASLEIIEEADLERMMHKGKMLSDYLIFVLEEVNRAAGNEKIKIITSKEEKGCQVSFQIPMGGKHVFDIFRKNRVLIDWFEPGIMRAAPVPLYNTFEEIYTFGQILMKNIVPQTK